MEDDEIKTGDKVIVWGEYETTIENITSVASGHVDSGRKIYWFFDSKGIMQHDYDYVLQKI